MIRSWIITGAVLTLAFATGSQAAGIAECAEIEDDQQRLACFDAAARAPTSAPAPAPVQETVTTRVPVPISSPSVSSTRATGSTAADAQEPAAPEAAAAVPNTAVTDSQPVQYEELFGLENQVLSKGSQEIHSRIMSEFDGWDDDTVFELENGQVWKQADVNSSFTYRGEPNPTATIKKGYFGSFRLKIDGYNKSVRVKRVK